MEKIDIRRWRSPLERTANGRDFSTSSAALPLKYDAGSRVNDVNVPVSSSVDTHKGHSRPPSVPLCQKSHKLPPILPVQPPQVLWRKCLEPFSRAFPP